MKKLILLAATLFFSATLFAGGITVVSGDPSILKTPGTAKIVFNYAKTYVGEDGARTQTLNQYLKSRGSDYVRDWPDDHKQAEEWFVKRFNKMNKKGLTIATSGTKYIVEVIGFNSKAGGVIMWGDILVKDAKGKKVLLKLRADGIKGKASPSETMRLGLCYMDLAGRIAKLKVK